MTEYAYGSGNTRQTQIEWVERALEELRAHPVSHDPADPRDDHEPSSPREALSKISVGDPIGAQAMEALASYLDRHPQEIASAGWDRWLIGQWEERREALLEELGLAGADNAAEPYSPTEPHLTAETAEPYSPDQTTDPYVTAEPHLTAEEIAQSSAWAIDLVAEELMAMFTGDELAAALKSDPQWADMQAEMQAAARTSEEPPEQLVRKLVDEMMHVGWQELRAVLAEEDAPASGPHPG